MAHKSCTDLLGAPSDMPEPDCEKLPVHYEDTEFGKFAVSYWRPTPEELLAITQGAIIQLWVRAPGRQHPVVAITVVKEE